jgi:uncharacterized repeat protein (TIGR01451 family)
MFIMEIFSVLPNPKRLPFRAIVFWIFCVCTGTVWGKAAADITIDTQVSGDVIVCSNQVTFTITIENTSSSGLSSLKLFPRMPEGMTYVSGTATGMTAVNDSIFDLPALAAGSSAITVSFKAQADCRLISYIKNQGSSTTTYVNNKTVITYTKDGTDLEISEPNGSDSYNVLYPVFEMGFNPSFPDDDDMKPVHYKDRQNRHIQVKNTGTVSVGEFSLKLVNDEEVKHDTLLLTDATGNTTLATVSVTSYNAGTNTYIFTITNFDGQGKTTFSPGETLYFTDRAHVEGVNAAAQTDYSAQWGCKELVCNEDDQNAVITAYIESPTGTPVVADFTLTDLTTTDFGSNKPCTGDVSISNTGSGSGNSIYDAMYDIRIDVQVPKKFKGIKNYLVNTANGAKVQLTDPTITSDGGQLLIYEYNLHKQFPTSSADPDGTGSGLSDADGDGAFDDLEVGQNFKIETEYSLPDTLVMEGCDVTGTQVNFISIFIKYKNWNNVELYKYNKSSPTLFSYTPVNLYFTGTTDLGSGEVGTYDYKAQVSFYSQIFSLSNSVTVYKLELPAGYELTGAKNTRDNETLTPEHIGNYYLMKSSVHYLSQVQLELEITQHCTGTSSGVDTFNIESYYYFDDNYPQNYLHFGCKSYTVVNHCEACTGLQTSGFTAKRTTLGWKKPASASARYTYDEMYSTDQNKVDPATTTLRLNAVYPEDKFQVIISGAVTADTYHGLHATMTYESPLSNVNFFQFLDGKFVLDGTEYPISSSPTVSVTGKIYTIDFDISDVNPVVNAVPNISTGSTFQLVANFKDKDTTGLAQGEYLLDNFRAHFTGTNSQQKIDSCTGYGTNFYLLQPDLSVYSSISSEFSCTGIVNIVVPFMERAARATISNITDFPNEFRPIALLSHFSLTLPDGFIFDPQNRTVNFCYYSTQIPLNNVTFSDDNKTLTFTMNGSETVRNVTYSYVNYYFIKASVTTDANYTPPSASSGITYSKLYPEITLKKFAYLPDPSEHVDKQFTQVNYMLINTSPNTQLSANSVQDGFSKSVTWPVHFCNLSTNNGYSNKTVNAWVAVELRQDDQSTALGIPTDEDGVEMTDSYTFYNNKRGLLIQLGDINFSTCTTVNIPATYTNCLENVTQDIDMYGSWSCAGQVSVEPTATTVIGLEDNSVTLMKDTLSLRYKTADMQWTVNNTSAAKINLCEPAAFEIALTSTKQGNMDSLALTAEIPAGDSLVQQAGTNQPYYTYNGTTALLDNITWESNKATIDVSSLLPDGELPGTTETGKNIIKIGLNVIPKGGTGFDASVPVRFHVSGRTNCNDDRAFDAQHKIRLLGLDTDSVGVSISGTTYQSCTAPDNSNVVTLTLTNLSSNKATVFNKLEIILSKNIQFGSLLSGGLATPSVNKTDTLTTVTFAISDGFLSASETKTITFSTTVNTYSSDDAAYIGARTVLEGTVYSACSKSTETVEATTGSGETDISLSDIFPLVDITGYNILAPVCKNTRVRLTADVSGSISAGDCAFLWAPAGQTSQVAVIRVTAETDVTVQVTAPNGCTSSAETYLSVLNRKNPLDDVEVKASFDCSVPSGTLAVEHTKGNQYQWIKDGEIIPGAVESSLSVLESGTYMVYVINNACGTASDEIPVTLKASDNALTVTLSQTLIETGYKLRALVTPWKIGTVYSWNWGDNTKTRSVLARTNYHTYSVPGTYDVGITSTSLFGCATSTQAAKVRVVKSLCASTIPVNTSAAFYLDKLSGRIVFRDPACSGEIDLGCMSGQAEQPDLRRAVNASAITYNDQWSYNDDDFDPLGGIPSSANIYDIGRAGKWRPNASYTYYSNLTASTRNYDAGTFTLEAFNYQYDDCNNTSRWVMAEGSEYYHPNGNLLQKRDALGIPSSEKYGYNGTVVYISAQNAEKDDIFFESFENVYSVNGNSYFEDNMLYRASHSLDSVNAHAGKKSALLSSGSAMFTRAFHFTQQVLDKGLLVQAWVRVNDAKAQDLITANLVARLLNEPGVVLAANPFKIIAHVGDWFLVESTFTGLDGTDGVEESITYIPVIYSGAGKDMNIDDVRIQPADAKTAAYVFDPGTLKILVIFDEQLFGLFHQYDQEGKLIRKQVETEKGKRTIQEMFYNTPKSTTNPDDQRDS